MTIDDLKKFMEQPGDYSVAVPAELLRALLGQARPQGHAKERVCVDCAAKKR